MRKSGVISVLVIGFASVCAFVTASAALAATGAFLARLIADDIIRNIEVKAGFVFAELRRRKFRGLKPVKVAYGIKLRIGKRRSVHHAGRLVGGGGKAGNGCAGRLIGAGIVNFGFFHEY